MNYKNILTEEQKEAFRKGDRYYVSPFKNKNIRASLCEVTPNSTGSVYCTTTYARIYEAKRDRIISQQWN